MTPKLRRGRARDAANVPGPLPASGEVTPTAQAAVERTAVGYIRVSTDRQVQEGAGLEVQRDAITAWAVGAGVELVQMIADEGKSGGEGLEVRVGLGEALEAVSAGRAGGVAVYRLDRLARDLIVQEQLLADVWRRGGEVWSTSSAEGQYLVRDDPADPSRKLIRQILGAVSEYERAMIRLRMAGGRARKAASGGYAFGGPPYGWQAHEKQLVAVEAEQLVIVRISELDDEGWSLREIADQLNEAGVRTRRGLEWRSEQVRRVLSRR